MFNVLLRIVLYDFRMRGIHDNQAFFRGQNVDHYLYEIYRMIFISRLQEVTFNSPPDDPLDQRYS
ncbi:hypothetical protein DSECCO2_05800 [anaerobic digester metagenome]|jgi:hypothetical protein